MADTKISGLTAVTTVNDTDELALNQGAVSKKVTIARLNRKVTNSSSTAQSLTAGTLTNFTGSTLAIPTGVTVGLTTQMQWKIVISKTAAGTAANVFTVRAGTTGTTSDTALFTFTTGLGTAVADTGRIDILVTFKSVGSGTGAVAQGTFTMGHNLSATGLIVVPMNTITATSAGFDSTVANTIWSVSGTMGTSAVITVNQVACEAVNV